MRQVRDLKVGDILGRKTVEIDTKDVSSFIRDKVVLVAGAGGTIGSELCRQMIKFTPGRLILYDYSEDNIYFLALELRRKYPYLKFKTVIGDIKDIDLLKYTFSRYKPQVVFHSAAHKHAPLMEENPATAVKNNIIGTKNFMDVAKHYGVESFVMISTDKAVNPTSVMGASKHIADLLIQAEAKDARTKFMSVRFSNVIDSSGNVVEIFKRQIETGEPITITHPEAGRFFMTAGEAAQLIMQAGAMGKGGEIFILDMGEQVKIVDLAKNLITLSGLKPDEDIEIKFIGLRPGEKIGADKLLDKEHDKATNHNKIYIAQPSDFNSFKLRKDIKKLERLATLMTEDKIIEKIKEMVPSYSPNRNNKHND